MNYIDYYKILGIDKKATPKDIKNAYRKLARKFHPDLNPNDKDAKHKFQQINEANEVLSDIDKRKKFDEYGENWQHAEEFENASRTKKQQYRTANNRGQQFYEGQYSNDFSDFFSSMFGNTNVGENWQNQDSNRGQDFNSEIHLNMIDAYTTHKRTLSVNGKNIRITIPAGIENGQTIKIKEQGCKVTNGEANGDLFLKITIDNNHQFNRLGNNLYKNVDLDLYTAILGGEITIDTLKGKVKLKVKPETQNGSKVKLKGQGFPIYKTDGEFGDLHITYSIKMPTNLNEKQVSLFVELSKM